MFKHSKTPGRLRIAALLLAPPITVAAAVLLVTIQSIASSGAELGWINFGATLFVCGAVVGYAIEFFLFVPPYWIIRRYLGAPEWTAIPVGALTSGSLALLLHVALESDAALAGPDFYLNLGPWLTALGATGGAFYWGIARKLPAPAPFNGLSGSQT